MIMLIAWGVGFLKAWQLPLKPLGETRGIRIFLNEGCCSVLVTQCKRHCHLRHLEAWLCLRSRGNNQGMLNHRNTEFRARVKLEAQHFQMTCPRRIPSWLETQAQASNSELRVLSLILYCLPKKKYQKET